MNNKYKNCPVCGKVPRIKSHIIPEAFDIESSYLLFSSNGFPKRRPSGIWDWLLCDDCDNKWIGRYDNYGIQCLKYGRAETYRPIEVIDGKIIRALDYDYQKLSGFILSCLWRACLSSNEFYSAIHDDEVTSDLNQLYCWGNLDIFNFFKISFLYHDDFPTNGLMISPDKIIDNGVVIYRFLINNLYILIYYKNLTTFESPLSELNSSGTSIVFPIDFSGSRIARNASHIRHI